MRINLNPEERQKISIYLIIIIIAGFGFNLFYKYDRYYVGEPLVSKELIIKGKPKYIELRRGTNRYEIRSFNYSSQFWISEGTLIAINSNEKSKNQIERLNIGDTLNVKIRKADELKLQNSKARLRVIELSINNTLLVSKDQVESKDKKSLYLNFGFPILCFIILIILQIKKKKNNK